MSKGEKSIVLTILKIFNWQNSRESSQFHLAFYSLKTSSLIMEKEVGASITKNEIIFNYSLRISYLEDENQIVIRLSHFSNARKNLSVLGEFTLNLDYLAKKKIQFFPFGKNDKVLKITLGEPQQTNSYSRQKVSNNQNQIFIREKESFLRKIANNTSSTSVKNENSRSKKSFSEKAHELLNEVQSMKQNNPQASNKNCENQFNDYYENPYQQRVAAHNYDRTRKLGKSESEHKYRPRGLNPILNPSQEQLYAERSSDQKSNRSQKHKLQLKNLQMVPVENEYYNEPLRERKLQRKSDILSQNYHSKQKLFRSQH